MFKLFKKADKDTHIGMGVIDTLNARHVEYVIEKNKKTYAEKIIGRNGCINLVDDKLVIMCENKIVFSEYKNNLKAFELLNLSGVTIDKIDGADTSIIAYYKYYRK